MTLPLTWNATSSSSNFWHELMRAATNADQSSRNLWQILQTAIDLAQWKPAPAEGIVARELRDRTGTYHVLKNPRTRTYLRLSPREFWLWQKLDGAQSVQQLVVAYFLTYKTFAFALVVGLVQQLYTKQMLREPPQFVFAQIAAALKEQNRTNKLARPLLFLLSHQWTIRGLDRAVARLHQLIGRLLFSRGLQVFYAIASVAGVLLYLEILADERFRVVASSNVGINLALLWLLTTLPVIIHELAHALTVKHYGREVHRGGLMLSLGLPAAFVDTTDIWMEPKRARLAVAWAGPYTGFILAGICESIIWLIPDQPIAPFLFQIATVGLVLSLLNLNPALNLDGYLMLSDAVEIPRLRERSFAFLRHSFLPKLLRREKFSRDEIIYVGFGALLGLWTLYVAMVTLVFWRARVVDSVQAFLRGLDPDAIVLFRVALLALALAVLIALRAPITRTLTRLADLIRRLRLVAGRRRAALAIGLAISLLMIASEASVPGIEDIIEFLLGVAALAASAYAAILTARALAGSQSAPAWRVLAGALLLFGIAHILWWIPSPFSDAAAVIADFFAVLFAGVAFAMLGPFFVGLRKSWRAVSILFLIGGWFTMFLAIAQVPLLPQAGWHQLAGLLFLGGFIHWHAAALRAPALEPIVFRDQTARIALTETFKGLTDHCLAQLAFCFGAGGRQRVEKAFDQAARQKGWEIQIRAGKDRAMPAESSYLRLPASDLGEYFAALLGALLKETARLGGAEFARGALARSYDLLDWELREIASDYVFPHLDWASALSEEFRQNRNDVLALLQRAPVFAEFSEQEIKKIAGRLRVEHIARGKMIIQQGDPGDKFYILRRGRVEVLQRDEQGFEQFVREIVPGDYFGERALLTGEPRNATVRALTPVEALTLTKREFDKLMRPGFEGHVKVDTALQRLNLLRRIPIFADFDIAELQQLTSQLERQKFREGQVIVQQGDSGDRFYIIEEGQVAVRIELPNGEVRETSRLGTGEFFGEIALLMDVPRTATVVTTQTSYLFSIRAEPFKQLLHHSNTVNRVLERTATRRFHSYSQTISQDARDV